MSETEILRVVFGVSVTILLGALGWWIRHWIVGVDTKLDSSGKTVGNISERVKSLETHIPLLVSDVNEIRVDVRQMRAANERFHEFAFGRLGAPSSVGPYSIPKEDQE